MVDELIAWLKSRYPTGAIKLTDFPVGDIIIDVTHEKKYLMIEYYNKEKVFGMSLLTDDTLPFTPHDHFARNLEDAKQLVSKLLS